MVICIIALIVFGIAGIFSATHRRLFKEALHCLKMNLTLRPCETGFDQRIKYAIARRITKYPRLYSAFYRYFNIFSWILVILLFTSMAYSGYAIYNLAVYKTCSPENPSSCPISAIILINKTNYTAEECARAFASEIKENICKTPPGYTDESWFAHMKMYPERYAGCLLNKLTT